MQYRKDKKGEDISLLGYGCMRFSKKGNKIDLEKAKEEIKAAYEQGVNYYDTAYIYPGSEVALGKILADLGIRENVKIATKLPHYMIKSKAGMEKIFNEQLSRLQTDYIDYYLMHMLTDIESWNTLKEQGIVDWIQEKLESGAIRNIGFSYHGATDMFIKLIDAYDWDFTQIQYNYMDEHSQAGRKGLNYAAEKGIPVVIMEPLRGGRLVDMLPSDAKKEFDKYETKRSYAEWAFRWLYDQKEVTCVLSGMNSLDMVNENVKTAAESTEGHLTDADRELYERVKLAIKNSVKVGCTGCGYCMPCPKNVDIPGTFRCYNISASENKSTAREEYLRNTAFRKDQTSASNCIECGACEKHCPQGIEIRKELKNAKKVLETPTYKIAKTGIRLLKLW